MEYAKKHNSKEIVAYHAGSIKKIRRALHMIPECAHEEMKTSEYIKNYLRQKQIPFKSEIGGHGILVHMDFETPGNTLLLRADMDALPIVEETGLSFSSKHTGKMHACGHDGHMAMLLGALTVIYQLKEEFKGSIKFLFQPAEEETSGAKALIDAGVMESPEVDYSVGIHLWPEVMEGQVGVKEGPLMAADDHFEIKVVGKGGHGAMPHLCVDPIDVGVQVINSLQRLVSRRIDPLQPVVLTIGSFQAGNTFNVIPTEAIIKGTTRTFDQALWKAWPEKIEQVISGVCNSMGAAYRLKYIKGCPPLINDPFMTNIVKCCAINLVGERNVVEPEPTMGGEDMAYYLQKSQGCYIFLGIGTDEYLPLHNSKFNFNDDVLLTGVELYCDIALKLLGKP